MSNGSSSGKIHLEVSLGPAVRLPPRSSQSPFHLAVLGDFSRRTSRGLNEAIGQRRVWRIDSDNFDQAFEKLDVRLQLPFDLRSRSRLELRFTNMEAFHPDQLLEQVPELAERLKLRKGLLNPASAAAAAARLEALLKGSSAPQIPAGGASISKESDEAMMERLLGSASKGVSPTATQGKAGLDSLIKSIVGASAVPAASAQQRALLSASDLELAAALRSILHQPELQALEAAWRGMDLLVRNFGGEENIKLLLVDIAKEELAADLQGRDSLEQSGLWKILRTQWETQPWAVWLGEYSFADKRGDIELLGLIAKLAGHFGAPFLSSADAHLAGCDSFGLHADPDDWKWPISAEARQAWQALRGSAEGAWVGLALPRFLQRQPYGKHSDPIDAFPFEEILAEPSHESYLWGNSSILCGYLLADAFRADGWEMQTSGYGEVGELPVHKVIHQSEMQVKPCAEAWLSERGGDRLLANGLIAVLSIKGRDAVRVPRIQSIAGKPFRFR